MCPLPQMICRLPNISVHTTLARAHMHHRRLLLVIAVTLALVACGGEIHNTESSSDLAAADPAPGTLSTIPPAIPTAPTTTPGGASQEEAPATGEGGRTEADDGVLGATDPTAGSPAISGRVLHNMLSFATKQANGQPERLMILESGTPPNTGPAPSQYAFASQSVQPNTSPAAQTAFGAQTYRNDTGGVTENGQGSVIDYAALIGTTVATGLDPILPAPTGPLATPATTSVTLNDDVIVILRTGTAAPAGQLPPSVQFRTSPILVDAAARKLIGLDERFEMGGDNGPIIMQWDRVQQAAPGGPSAPGGTPAVGNDVLGAIGSDAITNAPPPPPGIPETGGDVLPGGQPGSPGTGFGVPGSRPPTGTEPQPTPPAPGIGGTGTPPTAPGTSPGTPGTTPAAPKPDMVQLYLDYNPAREHRAFGVCWYIKITSPLVNREVCSMWVFGTGTQLTYAGQRLTNYAAKSQYVTVPSGVTGTPDTGTPGAVTPGTGTPGTGKRS